MRLDIGTISSSNSAVLRYGVWRIIPSFDSKYFNFIKKPGSSSGQDRIPSFHHPYLLVVRNPKPTDMDKEKIEKVIEEIFDPMLLGDEFPKHILNSPVSYKQLTDLAALIITDQSEESFQQFIAHNPNFLFRLAPSTDDTNLGLLAKPPISVFNTADFGIFSVSQGGARIFLIELERPSDRLFTKKLTPAQKLQTAIGQVQDWDQWIRNNRQAFISACFKILKKVPKYPKSSHNGSFIYRDPEHLEDVWNGFGGTEHCTIEYLIVIGRWSQMSKEEQERLMYLSNQYGQLNLRIRTYDNLARKAFDGPKYFW